MYSLHGTTTRLSLCKVKKKKILLKINEAQEYYEKKLQIKSKKHFNKKSA